VTLFNNPFPIVLTVLIIFIIVTLYDIVNGIYLLIFLIPFSPSAEVFSINGRPIGITLEFLLSTIIIFFWFTKKISKNDFSLKTNQLFIPGMLLLIVTIVSLLQAGLNLGFNNITTGIVSFIVLLEFIIVSFILVDEVDNDKQRKAILHLIFIAGMIVSALSLGYYLLTNPSDFRLMPIFDSILRGENVKSNPNSFAAYLFLTPLIGLVLSLNANIRYKIVYIVGSFVAIATIFFTGSRSGLIGLLLGLMVIGWFKSKRVLLVLFLGGILFSISISDKFVERYQSIGEIITSERIHKIFFNVDYKDIDWNKVAIMGYAGYGTDIVSGALRITHWIEGMQMVSKRPLLGYGYRLKQHYSSSPTSENYFLDLWIMIGLIGLSVFLIIMYLVIKNSQSLIQSQIEHYSEFGVISLAYYGGIIMVSLTGSVLFSSKVGCYFWIINGLLISYINEKNITN